jgi:hypothetical protein
MKKFILVAVFALMACVRHPQVSLYPADEISPGELLRAGIDENDVLWFIQNHHKLSTGMHLPIVAYVCGQVDVVDNDRWLWICNPTGQVIRINSQTHLISQIFSKRTIGK